MNAMNVMNAYKNRFIEEEKIYVTSELFYYNQQMYYLIDQKPIKLTKQNWHQYLKEYGWELMNEGWITRLGNKHYGILDCGADGNCLFHCVSEALNKSYNPDKFIFDFQDMRKKASEQVTEDNFDVILANYKAMQYIGEFEGGWDPSTVRTVDELKRIIEISEDHFWGDHIIIQLLQKSLNVNIILLNNDKEFLWSEETNLSAEERFNIHPLAHNINEHPLSILLYYIDGIHFQLVGYFNGKFIQTIFKTDKLPSEFMAIYNNDCKIK